MLLLVFHGSSASPMEKVKASGLAQAIDDERNGEPERETYHDGQTLAELEPFWKALGGGPPQGQSIMTAEEGGSDADVKVGEKRLLKVSDASGKISMELVAKGDELSRNLVSSDDVFILDDGYEVMVWVGLGASSKERKEALNFAQQYLNEYNEPSDKVISRMLEGGDNEQFEAAFEVGVMSTARPGDGVKFSGDINKIRGMLFSCLVTSSPRPNILATCATSALVGRVPFALRKSRSRICVWQPRPAKDQSCSGICLRNVRGLRGARRCRRL